MKMSIKDLFPSIVLILAVLSSGCSSLYEQARSEIFHASYYKSEAKHRLNAIDGILEKSGFDVNERDKFGCTLLYRTCSQDYPLPRIAGLLIERGADVNAAANSGSTPLMQAVRKGHEDLVRVLLEHGADANLSDNDGNSALSIAIENNSDLVDLLTKSGADFSSSGTGKDGKSPLILAAMSNNTDVIESLLDKGGDVNHLDSNGMSALGWASGRGHIEAVKLLIARGADVNLGETTPLERAFARSFTNLSMLSDYQQFEMSINRGINDKVIEILAENGAKLPAGAEGKFWKLTKKSISIARLKLFINAYPAGEYATTSRLYLDELETVDALQSKPDENRCIIPLDQLTADASNSPASKVGNLIGRGIANNSTRGRVIFNNAVEETGDVSFSYGDAVTFVSNLQRSGRFGSKVSGAASGPYIPCGNGSILIFSGDNGNFFGAEGDPLKLAYVEETGLVYLGGKGSVRDGSGGLLFSNIDGSKPICAKARPAK